MYIQPCLSLIDLPFHDVSLSLHFSEEGDDRLSLGDLGVQKEFPVLAFEVTVNLSYYRVQKLLAVQLLHCLIEVHYVRIRTGYVSQRVLNFMLYLVIIMMHGLIILLLLLFTLYSGKCRVPIKGFLFPTF